jgi:hypothetical protein
MNATNPNTAMRFLEINDSFPIPGSDTYVMHEPCQPWTGLGEHV